MSRYRLITLALLTLWAFPAAVTAIEKKPLPDFPVTSPQGHPLSSQDLGGKRHWLLVVLSPTDPLGDRLLDAFSRWPQERWLGRTIFLVEGPVDGARAALEKHFPNQTEKISWVSDESRKGMEKLQLQGLPVILGLDGLQMEWTISGVLSDPSALESVVRSWLKAS